MKFIFKIALLPVLVTVLFSCKKDVDPIITVPVSDGSQLQLNGLVGTEPGSSAGNTVFVDLSGDKQLAVERKSWDLGFYCGNDFRVILNNTSAATAKKLAKTDLSQVNDADTVGLQGLALGFDPSSLTLVDDVYGDLSKTVIGEVSESDGSNNVYIVNPGTGGGIPQRDWYKIRIMQNVSGGYRLQYAKLASSTFSTIDIAKDVDYNFRFFSFDGGGLVNAEPVKNQWDIKWSYQVYTTSLGPGMDIAYPFADMITINFLAGVKAAEVLTSTAIYEDFTLTQANALTYSSVPDIIGSKWRSTNPATGVKTDRFYVIKDAAGNTYKLKFLAMGVNDGGTRGKPQFEYKLL